MSYLPQTPPGGGFLPYWLLVTSAASLYNVAQNFFILWQTREIYLNKPQEVTALTARLFGAWTLLAAIIRTTAAYEITDPTVYNLVISTYAVAGFHFTTEYFIFKTVKLGRASGSVFSFAIISLVWTISQRDYYIGK